MIRFYDIICNAISLREGGVCDIAHVVKELKAKFSSNNFKNIHMVGAAVVCLLIIMSFFIFGGSDQVLLVDDQPVAKISSKRVFDQALEIIKGKQEAEYEITLTELHTNIILSSDVKFDGKAIDDPEKLAVIIQPYVSSTTSVYALRVNGEEKVFVRSKDEAEMILESIKADFVNDQAQVLSYDFREEVEIVPATASANKLMDVEDAKNFILTGTDKIEVYKVAKGDTLSTIAQRQGIALRTLREANPQLKNDFLSIGQELKLVKLEPVIHVMVTKELTLEETIPFGTRTINTDQMWRGQTQVQKAGERGLREVTYKIVSENGKELERTELNAVVLKEPSVQEVLRGTKQMTASRGGGDGQLGWPLRGTISSRYGPRGGGFHTGIDIVGSRGTPIYSAGNGTVIFAGWGSGGYGNLVIIDHGNGLTTKYAHLTAINVSMAQNVQRGDVVGTVGTTGRSSGPHLHFETNINGRHVDPMRYLGN